MRIIIMGQLRESDARELADTPVLVLTGSIEEIRAAAPMMFREVDVSPSSRAERRAAPTEPAPSLGLVDVWPRLCACGRSHTETEWSKLPFLGVMASDADSLELRNCVCGSTIAQEIETA